MSIKNRKRTIAAAALCLACAAQAEVSFTAWTVPSADGLSASVEAARKGGEWNIAVTAKNATATNVTFKLVLEAAPGFAATRYLIPGVLYNGNQFVKAMQGNDKRLASLDIPTGWEKDGEPWTFSYDRCSIPSCTVSENTNEVFALFASVADAASHVSSCSLVRNADGSFRHRILWPVTEAPVSYSNKRTFTARRDTYLTLGPGETFTARAFACTARPPWPDYGFAAVFPVAWRLLKPDVPSQLPLAEVLRLDKSFQDWSRRRDENGSWYMPYLVDMTLLLGNYRKRAPKDLTIEDIEKDPSKNYWENDELEKSKKLKPGEYLYGPGSGIGFSAQSFQLARLSVEYGLRNNSQKDIDFGLEVFRSWIRVRQKPSGHFGSKWKTLKWKDASEVGWALAELSRLCILLKAHGQPSAEFEESATRQADAILRMQRRDGNLGSKWLIADGKVIEWGGDCGGYVLMGLARYWQLTRSERVRAAIRKAFIYYYTSDINHFECKGGAMDCSSIDREGIHPFFTAAVIMAEGTNEKWYVKLAQKAGWYFLSWLYCHNGIYGPETDFVKYNWKPAGSTVIGTEHPALDDYGCVLVADLFTLSRLDGNTLWRDVAALIWRNGTQGFPTEKRKIWHALERPPGAKNEAYFQTYWSKYRTGDRKRGHLNDLCTAWGGVYRTSAIYDLSAEDLLWLDRATRPSPSQRCTTRSASR